MRLPELRRSGLFRPTWARSHGRLHRFTGMTNDRESAQPIFLTSIFLSKSSPQHDRHQTWSQRRLDKKVIDKKKCRRSCVRIREPRPNGTSFKSCLEFRFAFRRQSLREVMRMDVGRNKPLRRSSGNPILIHKTDQCNCRNCAEAACSGLHRLNPGGISYGQVPGIFYGRGICNCISSCLCISLVCRSRPSSSSPDCSILSSSVTPNLNINCSASPIFTST
ncbi:hypothetical protein LF1_46040 [Rubripirellula obstinata]|uniref:Uncharacterized protein n=1 Tax=Rubripirellula obstinata TaxID=406547 RepID=A0A5B1CRN4_9BACT|nr:hypothetical protein LF1_46040 [Rubripirellula obstinata]